MRAALAYAIGAAVTLTGGAADLAYINVSLVPRMLEVSTTDSAVVVDRVETRAIELPQANAKADDAIDAAAVEPEREAAPPAKAYEVVAVVRFKFGSSELDDRARTEIASVTETLRADPHLRVRAHGHADERGPSPFNLDLSERRAQIVAAEIERLGIEAERIESRGFGEQLASERWSLDRRVEISIGKHSQDGGPGK